MAWTPVTPLASDLGSASLPAPGPAHYLPHLPRKGRLKDDSHQLSCPPVLSLSFPQSTFIYFYLCLQFFSMFSSNVPQFLWLTLKDLVPPGLFTILQNLYVFGACYFLLPPPVAYIRPPPWQIICGWLNMRSNQSGWYQQDKRKRSTCALLEGVKCCSHHEK